MHLGCLTPTEQAPTVKIIDEASIELLTRCKPLILIRDHLADCIIHFLHLTERPENTFEILEVMGSARRTQSTHTV